MAVRRSYKALRKHMLLMILLLFPILDSTFAANHYVREGAAGSANGDDWANAYTSLPPILTRGDAYYVADGNYTGYSFDDANSEGKFITIKKATGGDHGIETGWQPSYGDGQAVFAGTGTLWDISTGHWIIDGQTKYGFKLDFSGTGTSTRALNIDGSHVSIKHTEIEGNGHAGIDPSFAQDGVYIVGGQYSDINLSALYIHDWKRCGIILASGVHDIIVENSTIERTYSTAETHGQGIQIGASGDSNYAITIRNSIFHNIHGSGFIFYLGGQNSIHHDIDVYNNIFYSDDPANWNTATAIGTNTDTTCNNCNAYGNTFYGLTGRGSSGVLELDHGYGTARNNIFYASNTGFTGAWTATHTSSDDDFSGQQGFEHLESPPFVQAGAGNFRLARQTVTGTVLDGEFSTDIMGNERGLDGIWDRGAYEYWQQCISIDQLMSRITEWRSGSIAISQLISSIDEWKSCLEAT